MATVLSDVVLHTDTNGIERAYRPVRRRADIGELVRFTRSLYSHGFPIGSIVAVEGSDDVAECARGSSGYMRWFKSKEYEVLEPIGPSDLDGQDRITALESRVAELERKVAGTAPQVGLQTGMRHINAYKSEHFAGVRKAALTREEIIEKATQDIQALKYDILPLTENLGGYLLDGRLVSIRYVENRAKRTVVAIAHNRHNEKVILSRGKAKCAPDDCFNIHIGRAIALRRALDLPVPDYYVNAPKPTTTQVGDIVRSASGNVYTLMRRATEIRMTGLGEAFHTSAYGDGWIGSKQFCITDDSHDYGGEGA